MSDQAKTREQRVAEFEARKKARAEEEKAASTLIEDLEMKFDEELGARGKEFEIVETQDGPIVLALGTQVAFKKFNDSKKSQGDCENFVRPCVKFPDAGKVMAMFDKRPVYAVRCANALATLYGMKTEDENGKY
jgi:hypothetical protein